MFTISLEDRDFAYSNASEEELSTLALDVMQAQEELMTSAIKREVLITVVENIEHGKDLAKAIADKGDVSTAMVVAKESLKTNLSFIGQEHLADRIVVGTEDITTATEGIGEMAKKAWNKIKELAKKAWDFIMNLFNKVLSFFKKSIGSGKSPAESILMKLQKIKKEGKDVPKDLEIEKEELAKIMDNNIILIATNGGEFNKKIIDDSLGVIKDTINKFATAYDNFNLESVLVDVSNAVATKKLKESDLLKVKEELTKIKVFSALQRGKVIIGDTGSDLIKSLKEDKIAEKVLGEEPGKKAGYAVLSGYTASEVTFTVYVFNKFDEVSKFNNLQSSSTLKDIGEAFKAIASTTTKEITINKENIENLTNLDVKKLKDKKVSVLSVDEAITVASNIVKSLPDVEASIAVLEKSASKSKQVSQDFMSQIGELVSSGSVASGNDNLDIETVTKAISSVGEGVNNLIIKVKEAYAKSASKLAQEAAKGIPIWLLELTVKHAK